MILLQQFSQVHVLPALILLGQYFVRYLVRPRILRMEIAQFLQSLSKPSPLLCIVRLNRRHE